jgi:hypothetical protein
VPPPAFIRVALFAEPAQQLPISRKDALALFFRYGYASVLGPSYSWTLLAPPSVSVHGVGMVSDGSDAAKAEIHAALRQAGAYVVRVQS